MGELLENSVSIRVNLLVERFRERQMTNVVLHSFVTSGPSHAQFITCRVLGIRATDGPGSSR